MVKTLMKEQEQAAIERILSRAGLLSEYYNKAVAKVLVEAGYRKEEEVRKETLKEIFSWLHIRTKNGRVIDDTVLIKTAKETFGVEVDE